MQSFGSQGSNLKPPSSKSGAPLKKGLAQRSNMGSAKQHHQPSNTSNFKYDFNPSKSDNLMSSGSNSDMIMLSEK